ncbi:MAG TPA: BA14K family protein [Xanthobacteraceae bacterium]|nr:BA14K family protein [Xanthobacteraceae bacterium]
MSNAKRLLAAALLAGAGTAMLANPASAAPIAALQMAAPSALEHVRWGGHWGHGGCWGCGVGAGFVAGAIIGGALAAPYYYGPGYGYYGVPYYYGGGPYYYGAGPYYPAPAPVYGPAPGYGPAPAYYEGPAPGGDAAAYCARRFHSYDPRTGTYLGTDGVRHPCP